MGSSFTIHNDSGHEVWLKFNAGTSKRLHKGQTWKYNGSCSQAVNVQISQIYGHRSTRRTCWTAPCDSNNYAYSIKYDFSTMS
mmetsp:Transcript_51610/g.46363  ORF Transcript_51610/g.46363 Transcript_51610/m.46363 type:complete len:83 (-) Transcript_51610:178-426(-)